MATSEAKGTQHVLNRRRGWAEPKHKDGEADGIQGTRGLRSHLGASLGAIKSGVR